MVSVPLTIYTKHAAIPEPWRARTAALLRPAAIRDAHPRTLAGELVRYLWEQTRRLPHLADAAGELLELVSRAWVLESELDVAVFRASGEVELYGTVSRKVITDAGVAFLVDAWQNSVELENLRFHAIGSGTTAEAASQTALVTEFTTQYNPDNTRATGSLTEGASANIFRTVGTNTVDASVTVQEHGILSQAATGGGTLWDRSLTGGQSLGSGDSIQTTYDATCTSGG